MVRAKMSDLTNKDKKELVEKLAEYQKELGQLRVAKVTGGAAAKLSAIKVVRKSVARVQTVLSHQQRASLKKYFDGKKYVPVDLREKKTRAIRRRLTKNERLAKTEKAKKKETHFPARKFAVRQ